MLPVSWVNAPIMYKPLYYSSWRMCSNVIWVKAAEICFLLLPTQSCHSRAQINIYILFLSTPKFSPKSFFFHSKCLFFFWPDPNVACCEKAKETLWLFVTFLKGGFRTTPVFHSPAVGARRELFSPSPPSPCTAMLLQL